MVKYCVDNKLIDLDERDALYYGIFSMILNINKIILISLISLILGCYREVIIIAIIVGVLRFTSSGLHAQSNFKCTMTTIFAYLGGAIISRIISIDFMYIFIISLCIGIILCWYSPADTEKRPIVGKVKRKKLKVQTFISVMLILFLNLIINEVIIMNLTLASFFYQTISVLPITYKILGRSYKNYERFEI